MKRLSSALIITIAIFAMELIGGFVSNSLSLKSDAAHMFGDVLALAPENRIYMLAQNRDGDEIHSETSYLPSRCRGKTLNGCRNLL